MHMSNATEYDLALLEDFRHDVWGDDSIFKETLLHQSRIVEYLDFKNHLTALQSFCATLVETDKLLVLEEYRHAMIEFNRQNTRYWRGACITGQPGIGKSMFIAYAVVERLRMKQAVAVQLNSRNRDGAYVLFSENGVIPYDGLKNHPLKAYPGIWAFSDSNSDVTIPTSAFRGTAGVRVFQTTSPAEKRWKNWTKETGVKRYFMDLPSDEEIKDLARIIGYDVEKMNSFAVKWGRVPRTLLRLCRDPYEEESLEDVTRSYAAEAAQNISLALAAVRLGDYTRFIGASSIFFTVPRKEDNVVSRHRMIVYPPTDWITNILGDAVLTVDVTKKIEFFNMMSVNPETRSAAGWLFEKLMHHFLAEGGNHMLIHWHEEGAECPETFTLPHRSEICSNVDDLLHSPPFYWRPQQKDFEGIDGALVTTHYVLLFQMTLGRTHRSPQVGVDKVWTKSSETLKGLEWKLLFIGRDEERIKNVANTYDGKLQYGDMGTRGQTNKGKYLQMRNLPVGHVAIWPEKMDFQFTSVDRANIDHGPQTASTGAELGVSQGREESMDTTS